MARTAHSRFPRGVGRARTPKFLISPNQIRQRKRAGVSGAVRDADGRVGRAPDGDGGWAELFCGMTTADRIHLHGRSVLVRSTQDQRNPPTALRGTIDSKTTEGAERVNLRIVLEYPDMFTVPAHQGVIELDDAAAERLLAGEREGVFEFTIDEPLEPKLPEMGEREVS